MELTFAPKGILQIDEARIIHRNFSGAASKYNREGDRNFSLVIPTKEMADRLVDEGWNVKVREPRDEGDDPLMYLPVKVKFNERGPVVYLRTGERTNRLDERRVSTLDKIDILCVDMDIRPYDWEVSGKTGRTAYLQSICVHQDVDRFTARYAEEEFPEE